MNKLEQLKKYHSELNKEGVIKSVLFGLTIGFGIGVLIYIAGAISNNNLLLIGLIVSVVTSIVSSILLFKYLLKPRIEDVAARIDEFGLQERLITMVELQNDTSFIAKVQRDDTKKELSKYSFKLIEMRHFLKPALALLIALVLSLGSMGIMLHQVNAAEQNPWVDPTENPDDEVFQEMIDEILSIINNSNVPVDLKNTLYTMVVDLEQRLPDYDTYTEKYTDVLETRNEILMLIEEAIIEEEESLLNIAEELQKYETTEILGDALASWDLEQISEAFDYMYSQIEVLAGQEMYDLMNQTAIDIETALADAVGTDEAMAEALQDLADAYKIAVESFGPNTEEQTLDILEQNMDAAEAEMLEAVQALIDLVEELMELQDELEEEFQREEEFPLFLPWPEDSSDEGDEPEPIISDDTVIDGVTPYEDVYDDYYTNAMDWLANEDISDDLRQIIEDYFEMLD